MFNELKLPSTSEAARRTERRRDAFVSIALEHALEALAAAEQIGPLYPYWVQWMCTGMASGGVAVVFFGGSWWDGATSLGLGVMVGILGSFNVTADGEQRFLRAYEFVSATLVALLAKGANGPPCTPSPLPPRSASSALPRWPP